MPIVLTREQVRRIDRIAIDQYGMIGLVLMENAGRNAADIILHHIAARADMPSDPVVDRVVIFCGTGNNGGDGFVIARHLANANIAVVIAIVGAADRFAPDAAANHRICIAMGIPCLPADSMRIHPSDLIVDAMLGTGFAGQVRQPIAGIIKTINDTPNAGIVAIDLPSGLDCDTGTPAGACVVADQTITFVAVKSGFHTTAGVARTGRVHVADIGAPAIIVERVVNEQDADRTVPKEGPPCDRQI